LEELDLKPAPGADQSTVKEFKAGSTIFRIRRRKSGGRPESPAPVLAALISPRRGLFWRRERAHGAGEFGTSLGREQDQKVSE